MGPLAARDMTGSKEITSKMLGMEECTAPDLFAEDTAELVPTGIKGAKSLMVLMRVLCIVMAVILEVVMKLFVQSMCCE